MIIDTLYILLVALPALTLSGGASLLLNYWYRKFASRSVASNLTGRDVAAAIDQKYRTDVTVQIGRGKLTDNYNPMSHVVTLSERVGQEASIASVAIAAHEMGHVLQYHNANLLIRIRSLLVPAVSIGSNFGYILIIAGLILSAAGLVWVGVIFFSLSVLFTFLTLPVEFDASIKGMRFLNELGVVQQSEVGGVRKVLFAAALTYVAAAIGALLNLLYYVMQASSMSRD